jgi:hypothetical protein
VNSNRLRQLAPLTTLVVVAFLLSFGFALQPLQLSPAGTVPESTAPLAHASQFNSSQEGAAGQKHPVEANYLAISGEEPETAAGQPANAELLGVLLFTIFFGAVLWLLLGGRLPYRRAEVARFIQSGLPALIQRLPLKPTPSLLEVFRL